MKYKFIESYYVILIIIILTIISIIVSRNKIKRASINIKKNKSLIEVYLKERFDLIPNLVEVVKAYSKYENEVLKQIIDLRNEFNNNEIKNMENYSLLYNKFNRILTTLESYPELKANENYLYLQKELTRIENEISASRRIYNNSVTYYNNLINAFPRLIIASILGYTEEEWFNIGD